MKKPVSGFTLIEIMIAVAIIAILVSIALPQYQEYTIKTKRAEAKGLLLELTHYMERRFTEQGRYCENTPCAGTDFDLPFDTSPKGSDGNDVNYQLSLATGSNAPTATTYTLLASPQGLQETMETRKDNNNELIDIACGALSINQASVKCIEAGTINIKCTTDNDPDDLYKVGVCW